ncbi:MAG: hypothetical protein ACRED4_07220, partial [Brevundimonas sp.]
MKKTPINTAVLAALLATVALAGCKKKEDTADNNAQPAAPVAMTPAEPAAPQPMTAAAPVNVSAISVGKTAAADKSVAPTALFAPKDIIIV